MENSRSFYAMVVDTGNTREVDYLSEWGLYYRASHDRSLQVFKNLEGDAILSIWDDLIMVRMKRDLFAKDESRKIFMKIVVAILLPSGCQGISQKFSNGDVDFLPDDRHMKPIIFGRQHNGKPNSDKHSLNC